MFTSSDHFVASRPWRRRAAIAAICALLMSILFATAFSRASSADGPAQLDISTSPALYPTFSPEVSDYAVRCTTDQTIQVDVSAPSGETVEVDGEQARPDTIPTSLTFDARQP